MKIALLLSQAPMLQRYTICTPGKAGSSLEPMPMWWSGTLMQPGIRSSIILHQCVAHSGQAQVYPSYSSQLELQDYLKDV